MNRKLLTGITVIVLCFFTFVKLSLAEKVIINDKGFLLIDGKPFFPIGLYSTYPTSQLQDFNFNTSEGNQTKYEEETPGDPWGMDGLYAKAKENNLYNIPLFNGVSHCQSWNDWVNPDSGLANIAWAKQFVKEVKNKERLLAYYPVDEAGVNWRDRTLEVYQAIKGVDSNHPTIAVDNVWCPLKKAGGVWIYDYELGYSIYYADCLTIGKTPWDKDFWKYMLLDPAKGCDGITRAVWTSPYVDIVVSEDDLFGRPADNGMNGGDFIPNWSPLEHLIGTVEYARQITNNRKPIWAVFHLMNGGLLDDRDGVPLPHRENHWPTKDEIRSFFYTALGHGVRGILVYQWHDFFYWGTTGEWLPGARETLQNFKKAVAEIRGEVLPDYLQGEAIANCFTSNNSRLDVSSFYNTTNNVVYLIAVNTGTVPIDNDNISFPSLSQAVRVRVVGKEGAFNLPKGSKNLTVSLVSFQTQVFKWQFTGGNLSKFLGQLPVTTNNF